jgi:hypothetical protein
MSAYSQQIFEDIMAPRLVGVPPANASRGLVRLPDGEIRHYGAVISPDGRLPVPHHPELRLRPIYLSSRDNGLSWQEHAASQDGFGAAFCSPFSGDWLAVVSSRFEECPWRYPSDRYTEPGTFVCRSKTSIDGPFEIAKISERETGSLRQITALESRRRLITVGNGVCDGKEKLHVFYSDDDGVTWETVILDGAPPYPIRFPHQGTRPQTFGSEPSIVELSDGRLWMLFRTGDEYFYQRFSDDGGETWTAPEASRFPGSYVMPTFLKLKDGRLLLFWANAVVMPELDHDTQDGLVPSEKCGGAEDFFTNRDAFHAAISDDDGQTWKGFRELLLSPLRNNCDFRSIGGRGACEDKGLHQSQAVELPGGKILLAVGQHELSRFMLIFDPDWLLETERADDFSAGLQNWSTHQYVRSIAGMNRNSRGHCAYNRRPGPQLIPNPDRTGLDSAEVLQIARHPDPRLVHEQQGAVWNFPAMHAGKLECDVYIPAGFQGARLNLIDRWVSPVDPAVDHYATVCLTIDAAGRINRKRAFAKEAWRNLVVTWQQTDTDHGMATWQLDGEEPQSIELGKRCPNGISYLHLQSTAETTDYAGILIAGVKVKALMLRATC